MKTEKFLAAIAISFGITSNIACGAEEESIARKLVMVPVKSAGCFVALAVGTPIAIGRISVKRYHEYIEDVNDAEGTAGKAGGVVYALPMGFGEGFAQGLYYGPRNAFANFDKPFSKDQMSLGNEIIPSPR